MEKILLALCIFVSFGILSLFFNQNSIKANFKYILNWIFGFLVLVIFDLFMEAIVFEALSWNGTNKNDWFFMLWWLLVSFWFIHGISGLYFGKK